jgi:hypothetical protein
VRAGRQGAGPVQPADRADYYVLRLEAETLFQIRDAVQAAQSKVCQLLT